MRLHDKDNPSHQVRSGQLCRHMHALSRTKYMNDLDLYLDLPISFTGYTNFLAFYVV